MTITLDHISRLRSIAEADMNGADGKAWDEAITPDTMIALCEAFIRLEKEKDWFVTKLAETNQYCPFPEGYRCKFRSGMDCTRYNTVARANCWCRAVEQAMEEVCPKN